MRSYRKTILIALLVGATAAVISYKTTPTIPDTCKEFREQMKQLALSDGSLAGVVLTVPERLLDDAMEERYATMTAEQCTAAIPQINSEIEAFTHTKWAPQMRQAGEDASVAISQCRNKRVNGELKNHEESAVCSNTDITAAFTKINYPYMDLVKELTDKRLSEAQKLDKSLMEGTEDQMIFARLAFDLTEQERKKLGVKPKP